MIKCSVVILNWNGEQMLEQFLPSVIAHTEKEYEIVVADNGSTDGSVEMLRRDFPSVRTLVFDKNYGFAEGYNKAIEQVESEYIVLLNSDVEVTSGWLRTMIRYLDANPNTVAVQPKILSYDSYKKSPAAVRFEHAGAAGGYIDGLGYPYCRGRKLDEKEIDYGQYDNPAFVFWTSGACMVVRREAYINCGSLDADFFAHMEEIDLCWRFNINGNDLVCLPQSVVYHVGGGSLSYDSPRKVFLNFRNDALMLYKNMPTGRLMLVWFCRIFLDRLAALSYLLKGQLKNAFTVIKARYAAIGMLGKMHQKRKQNKQAPYFNNPRLIYPFSYIIHYKLHKS